MIEAWTLSAREVVFLLRQGKVETLQRTLADSDDIMTFRFHRPEFVHACYRSPA